MFLDFRTGLAGLAIGALLAVGGFSLLHDRKEPADTLRVTGAPTTFFPGYQGAVYDAKGRLIAYSVAPPRPTATLR